MLLLATPGLARENWAILVGASRYDNLDEKYWLKGPQNDVELVGEFLQSNDGSDLNLYVYDDAGRLVCSDTDVSSISYCGWRPSEGGGFTIKVENKGQGNAGYSLMTN